jgi:hypothetical protein
VTLGEQVEIVHRSILSTSVKDDVFSDLCMKGLDKISTIFDNIMVLGDLNYDMLHLNKGKVLVELCDIFDLTNVIKTETCHVKNCKASLVDVILTNKPQYLFNSLNFDCGISDCHNMIGTLVKGKAPYV